MGEGGGELLEQTATIYQTHRLSQHAFCYTEQAHSPEHLHPERTAVGLV